MPMSSYTQPTEKEGITLWPLVAATYFMASGGPYGLEETVSSAGYMGAILLILITPLIWSLPTGLMIAELSSAFPAEGGYYVWVRQAMGPFWGFQEAWLSLASSIFDLAIYPTLFVAYLGRLIPGADQGWHGIAIGVCVIVACVLWNLVGGKAVGEGSLLMLLLMIGPFAMLIVAAAPALARSPRRLATCNSFRTHRRIAGLHVELHGVRQRRECEWRSEGPPTHLSTRHRSHHGSRRD